MIHEYVAMKIIQYNIHSYTYIRTYMGSIYISAYIYIVYIRQSTHAWDIIYTHTYTHTHTHTHTLGHERM